MSDEAKDKVLEIIGNTDGIKLLDLQFESDTYIVDLFHILEALTKEDKIDLRVNGPFEYYHVV